MSSDRYAQLRDQYLWQVPARYNIAADVCDARDPDALAMLHEHHEGTTREVHWGEMQALSNQAANLLAGLGVERGDRVALVLPPTPETAALFFATWKLGAVLLSMSVLYGDEGIAHPGHRLRTEGVGHRRRERLALRGSRRPAPRRPRAEPPRA